jgi:hypothetical protein
MHNEGSPDHLRIARSTLPGAGRGLFTRRGIRRGERVVEYLGEIISSAECNRRAQQDRIGYVLWINRSTCIDAHDCPDALARYANDAAGLVRVRGIRNNAAYEIEGGRGYIVATRNIPAGSEILVAYGAEYWSDIRYNLRLERKQRRENLRGRPLLALWSGGREGLALIRQSLAVRLAELRRT